jgi:hypothetical protein
VWLPQSEIEIAPLRTLRIAAETTGDGLLVEFSAVGHAVEGLSGSSATPLRATAQI